jgi:hypothetical protein
MQSKASIIEELNANLLKSTRQYVQALTIETYPGIYNIMNSFRILQESLTEVVVIKYIQSGFIEYSSNIKITKKVSEDIQATFKLDNIAASHKLTMQEFSEKVKFVKAEIAKLSIGSEYSELITDIKSNYKFETASLYASYCDLLNKLFAEKMVGVESVKVVTEQLANILQ